MLFQNGNNTKAHSLDVLDSSGDLDHRNENAHLLVDTCDEFYMRSKGKSLEVLKDEGKLS